MKEDNNSISIFYISSTTKQYSASTLPNQIKPKNQTVLKKKVHEVIPIVNEIKQKPKSVEWVKPLAKAAEAVNNNKENKAKALI